MYGPLEFDLLERPAYTLETTPYISKRAAWLILCVPMDSAQSQTARDLILKWWNDAWTEGLWAAAWSKSIQDLSPEQAAWTPTPGRHSIWQIVEHMCFWRESWLRRAATGQKPTKEEIQVGNFPVIRTFTPEAWAATLARFRETQSRVVAALEGAAPNPALFYFLPHDCYHFGQINLLRAMQGLAPIE